MPFPQYTKFRNGPEQGLLFGFLFVSGADFEPDGGAYEAEGGADLVGEEALEGEVEFDVLIREQDEGGWGYGGLGHVIDADAAVHGDGRFLEVDLFEEAVHLAGGDALAALAGDEFDLLEEGFDSLARGGGDEDERGIVEVLELVADLLLVDFGVGGLGVRTFYIPPIAKCCDGWGTRTFEAAWTAGVGIAVGEGRVAGGVRYQAPRVDDDDAGAAGRVGVAADVGVERGDSFGGVEDEEGDVGGFEVLASHDDGELLGHELGLALATDAGGVYETEVVMGAGYYFVYCIPSGAGDRGDDGAFGAGEGVEQGGFAYVGTADDGDL